MRLVEEFVAGSIILFGKAITSVLMWGAILSVMGAGLALLVRGIYWLRFDYWITSICDAHQKYLVHNHTVFGNTKDFLCIKSDTGWHVLDIVTNWFLLKGDMSLTLTIFGLIILMTVMLSALILRFVPSDNFIRSYYEQNLHGYAHIIYGWIIIIGICSAYTWNR